ncbi:polynucleotide kinase-phosphatase [Leifsonia shinshuensis]|uniref:Polynucleotide kinase-phosphatase n=1 Tax=Leifsonia shinshuensis TaxID=150026 RepID=A0A853CUR4_9MICO|nr:polynucleotide kinase-phosphatase [Leifsonia shinshuensis]NYJ22325.1 polynucleotide kinase-phosphatase [Leifsonia shinshuensis]
MTELRIPATSLVVLVGVSGSGKSTFAREKFGPWETLSSDTFRGLVSNDENDQGATGDAFDALRFVAGKRLRTGLLTVIDATNVQATARKSMIALAKEHDVLPVAIVLDVPERVAVARTEARDDRAFGAEVIRRQSKQLRSGLSALRREGFRTVHVLRDQAEIDAATIVRTRLLNDRSDDHGPFDAIGDVHGCRSELETLLGVLGYDLARDDRGRAVDAVHPDGRRALFLGDLVDRGPDTPGVLRLAMGMVAAGHAIAVPGNHEDKLARALRGDKVTVANGLEVSLAQLAEEPPEFRDEVQAFCRELVSHLVLDDGRLVVAHAGLPEQFHGRASGRVRAFALYGDVTGEKDEYGLPVRLDWARDYRGAATVLYGHTPVPRAEWVNNTMCLDTGCVFGGALTALRYPERELVAVPAEQVWSEPARPFALAVDTSAERADDVLRIEDVLETPIVETRTSGKIRLRPEFALGALETMSRWAVDPRRLLYLPPTMSPPGPSSRAGMLEHPDEAFEAYRTSGVTRLIAEEKHMGSRAVTLVTRDPSRFGAPDGWRGIVHTRTGRRFFPSSADEDAFLSGVHEAVSRAALWEELETDWLLLDGEVLPWSLKAGALIREQYAAVGAAAASALPAAAATLERAAERGLDVAAMLERTRRREADAARYTDAYRRYVRRTDGIDGVQLAPFQVLAVEGRVHAAREHAWHLAVADRLVAADPRLLRETRRVEVDLDDPGSVEAAVEWWTALTEAGGEGMVVKPAAGLVRNERGLAQPGIKVRGREYLRIIYGPDYTDPSSLDRLRDRNVGHKRSMALREYALGLESLHRFVEREPLWRVHEAVFAVLAMESEPVDPRL